MINLLYDSPLSPDLSEFLKTQRLLKDAARKIREAYLRRTLRTGVRRFVLKAKKEA